MDEPERHAETFLILDEEGVVHDKTLEVGGDPPLPDAFGDRASFRLKLAGGVIIVERCARDVGNGDRHIRPALPQRQRDAGKGAPRSDRAHEAVDRPVRLRPDFRPGRPDMIDPGAFDFERYALSEGITATGYVREDAGNQVQGQSVF